MHAHVLTCEYTGAHTWYAHSHTCPQAHPGLWRLPRPQAAQACGAWHRPGHTLLGPNRHSPAQELPCDPQTLTQVTGPHPSHGGCHSQSHSRRDLISESDDGDS